MLGTMAWSDYEAPQLRVNTPRGGQQVSQLRTQAPKDNLTRVKWLYGGAACEI